MSLLPRHKRNAIYLALALSGVGAGLTFGSRPFCLGVALPLLAAAFLWDSVARHYRLSLERMPWGDVRVLYVVRNWWHTHRVEVVVSAEAHAVGSRTGLSLVDGERVLETLGPRD